MHRNLKRLALGGLLAAISTLCAAADLVHSGFTRNTGDVGIFVAEEKGYFKQENIEFKLTYFDSGARMVAPLGTGELDIGSAPMSIGLYNAAARKIDNRVVADRGRTGPGYWYQTLMVRKDLIESGRFKGYRDLKGLTFAITAPGISVLSVLNEAMKKGGLAYNDIEKVYIGYPQQVVAFRNKAIDAAMMIEPFATQAVANGDGVRFAPTEDFYPGDQISAMLFGEKFAREKADLARRFMRAYIRAVRDYNDAIENGQWTQSAKADEVIGIVARRLELKPEQIRAAYPHAVDPDGRVNVDSMRKDLQFFREYTEFNDPKFKVEDIIDMSFVEAAVRDLGVYKRAP